MLQFLVPVKKDRICYLSIPDYNDNAYYLYRHAVQNRTGLEHVWLVWDTRSAEQIRREFHELVADRPGHGHELRVLKKMSVSGYLMYLSSARVFHTHGAYAFSDTARKREVVALWHGMPIKAIGRLNRISPNPKPTVATASIATSQVFRYIIAGAFGLDAHAVEVCGLPRCDALRTEEACQTSRQQVRQILAIPDDRRLILWMPTYRSLAALTAEERGGRISTSETAEASQDAGRSFLDDLPRWTLEAMERAASRHGCTIVVKLHPLDVLNAANDPLPGYEHVQLVTSQDWLRHEVQLYDLIAASDALISDISSVLIDYLATRRPIALVGLDQENYHREPLLPLEVLFESARFRHLDDEAMLERFFIAVAEGVEAPTPPGDIAAALHDEFELLSSESVLRGFGV